MPPHAAVAAPPGHAVQAVLLLGSLTSPFPPRLAGPHAVNMPEVLHRSKGSKPELVNRAPH